MPAAMIKNEPRKTRNRDEADTQFEFMAWGCLVRKSPDTPRSVLLRNALACRDDSYATKKCLRPLRSFRRTRLSRVGVLAIADSSFWAPKSIAEGQEVRFCATQKPGRRGDRYPINCVLGPWRRSGTPPCCRIRPGSRTRPRRNR